MPSQKTYSWNVEKKIASKVLDKSSFVHGGTGIPKDITSFFVKLEMQPGEQVPIKLIYEGTTYQAYLEKETGLNGRTRMFWRPRFRDMLREKYAYIYNSYQKDAEPDKQVIMHLEKGAQQSYKVSFGVPEVVVCSDKNAEDPEKMSLGVEGGRKEFFGTKYERNSVNRANAIKKHGLTCQVCHFNFEDAYGEHGTGFIEVHHLTPVSKMARAQKVDPATELITLCANCHRMIHRNGLLTLEELRSMLTTRMRPRQK